MRAFTTTLGFCMPRSTPRIALATACALGLLAPHTWADSTSSASSTASASVGSSSTSLDASSGSSSSNNQVAQGPYTVVEMAADGTNAELLQLKLQAQGAPLATPPTMAAETVARTQTFTLRLPRQVAERAALAVGDTVFAQHRPYGLALATAAANGQVRPFFLVMDGEGHRDLDLRAVGG